MTVQTHILSAILIGKLTGNYAAAFTGAVLIDADHLISYAKHKALFNPKKMFKVVTTRTGGGWGDERGFFHSLITWAILSALLIFISFPFGLVFSIGYFTHLFLDAICTGTLYPLNPSKRFPIHGFIKYLSWQEIIFSSLLGVATLILFL